MRSAGMASESEWTVTLNTGDKMPAFGLGTWLGTGGAVEAALKAGYRSIDCAHMYFNEPEIGEALRKCFREGVVKREDVFITSKIAMWDHGDPVAAIKLALKRLQIDYLDLYLVHCPEELRRECTYETMTDGDKVDYSPESMAKCWKGMEECVAKGLAKAIGISNFSITKTETLLKTAKIVPAVNQVECHPYLQQPKLKDYCDSKGMKFMAYSPIGSPNRPDKVDSDPVVLEDPVINETAEKHKATSAQVCISFALHRGTIVIPKSVNPARIAENLKATGLKLDAEDMKRLRTVDKNFRIFKDETTWDTEADQMFQIM